MVAFDGQLTGDDYALVLAVIPCSLSVLAAPTPAGVLPQALSPATLKPCCCSPVVLKPCCCSRAVLKPCCSEMLLRVPFSSVPLHGGSVLAVGYVTCGVPLVLT
jgi:hypothetical protein